MEEEAEKARKAEGVKLMVEAGQDMRITCLPWQIVEHFSDAIQAKLREFNEEEMDKAQLMAEIYELTTILSSIFKVTEGSQLVEKNRGITLY